MVASNDINEGRIRSLKENNHEIDVMGIGTNLVTCQAQPALGVVYKVVEFQNIPRIKMSDEAEKILVPGAKSIMRAVTADNKPLFDVMCLLTEKE